ncbi:hypothetical protein AB1Y20_006415 [Prymnesium parvum]|uniref:Uncharacterized protein n=1 Tax=Prymnesium parvum TaxID=97485 RepID=A0AB34J2A0_PRYPA
MAAAASRAEANVPVCVALIALTLGLLVVLLSLRFACRLNEHEPRCLVQTVHPSGLIDGSADSPHSACFNASVAAAINERFRSATPSVGLEAAGLILHHFDGYENPVHWWRPCPEECTKEYPLTLRGGLSKLRDAHRSRKRCSLCQRLGDRFSAVVVNRAQQRRDGRRITVVTHHPGVLLRPSATKLLCAYGGDGWTMRMNCRQPSLWRRATAAQCVPGCGDPPEWCIPSAERRAGCRCDVGPKCTVPPRPVKPEALGWLLDEHARVGAPSEGVDTFTGYVELVVDSAPLMARPAEPIEAFFFVASNTTNSSRRTACRVHAAFLRHFKLDACHVPLLELRTDNWESPFAVHSGCRYT